MALTVETGTGSTTADSYLSVADCDTYHTNHGDSSDWSGATTAVKEMALRMGTQYLDAAYGPHWRGDRANETQALDWPRCSAEDDDGFTIDSDAIPQELKDALAEAALRNITETNGLLPDITKPGTIKREKNKVGPLEQELEYAGGRSQVPHFRKIALLLAPITWSGGRLVRS